MSRSCPEALGLDFRQPEAEPVTIRSSKWHGVQVEFSRLHLPAEYGFTWAGASHYLALHDLILADGEMTVDGSSPITGDDIRDRMTYVPASCGLFGWAKPVPRQNTFTVVYFEPDVMEHELQKESVSSEFRPHVYFSDPELLSTMKKLETAMAGIGSSTPRLYAETLGLMAALETFRLQNAMSLRGVRLGALTARQEKSVREFIEENLGIDFGLDDLASIVGLSRYHFCRRFKATFGMPPHRFVTNQRIEKVAHLLSRTKLPIAEIAEAVGFSSISGFNRAFLDLKGISPREYRKTILS